MKRSTLFESDINCLKKQVYQKRMIQAGILLTSIALPLSATLAPNQSIDMKLWELGLGSLSGLASMYVAKERKDIEARFQSFLSLHKENEKGSIKLENGFHMATQQIRGELNLAGAINRLDSPMARLRYANQFQISELVDTTITTEVLESTTEHDQPAWLDSPFQYTPVSQLKQGEEQASCDWIIRMVEQAIAPYAKRNHQHLIINAPTQCGKSTFAACFAGLTAKALNGNVQTLVIDPKHSDTNWLFPVNFGGYEEAYNGLKAAISILDNRKQQIKAAKIKPDFERVITILDEWNLVYGQGKGYAQIITKEQAEEMLADVQRLLAESAFVNMQLILIGQSPLSTDNGLSRPMMENATRITLGKTCIRWLNDKDFPNLELKPALKKQINKWLKDGRRCAMVVPMVGEPYCVLVPQINLDYFTQDEVTTSEPVEQIQDKPTNQTQYDTSLLDLIVDWYFNTIQQFGDAPNDATLKQAWYELTQQVLTDNALSYLREYIEGKRHD